MRVAVDFDWTAAGEVTLVDGRLVFARLPTTPGIYLFRLAMSSGARAYVGEAADLRKRAAGYRGGYAGQKTNALMRLRMTEHLASGGAVEVSIATVATVSVDDQVRPLDFRRKASRLLAENAAIHAIPNTEPLENLPGIGDLL